MSDFPSESERVRRLEHHEHHYHSGVEKVIEVTQEGFKEIGNTLKEQGLRMTSLEKETALQGESLKRMLHLLDGNGHPPLAVRLAQMEKDNEYTKKELEELNKKVEALRQSAMDKMWDLLKPLIAAGLAAAGAAAATGAL